ncbi:hypothetical protein QEJ31_15305 [Pigmentibacter sp. JX0631]|uniref:hypothetical protein n=1 Tax=Pigmentibacter sp. JX0631 TaxID=2976982 RepID=UPI0024687953|nr:hypothetical protein [Pigmentibacter sp. JX0631]WGL59898.1 hypothetical protein QEJ31_15305 [Pigmentibacter sp. JX0631]
MSAVCFYITENLSKILNQNQLDAIELACKNTSHVLQKNIPNTEIVTKFNKSGNEFILCDGVDFLFFVNKAKELITDKLILMPNEKELGVFEKYKEEMKNIRFLIGLIHQEILKAVIIQILSFKKSKAKNIIQNLSLKSPETYEQSIEHSSERVIIQSKVADFFSQLIQQKKDKLVAGSASYAKILSDIVDEFLMNAIWDACPARSNIDRTQTVALEENERIELKCLFSDTTLVLSVEDKFGTFKGEGIAKYIRFGVGYKETEPIQEGYPGAGLGIFMILQKIGILIFEVDKGKLTRATVVARGDQSIRDVQRKPKTVLFFEK